MTATCATLGRDLCALGVESGDILFIHSSFKSLGPVDGGASTVVAALEDAVGPDGLVLMPSFSLVPGDKDLRAAKWDRATTPSTVGWLTEYFRQMPGTVRSDHYSHAVAARGRRAEADRRAGCLEERRGLIGWRICRARNAQRNLDFRNACLQSASSDEWNA